MWIKLHDDIIKWEWYKSSNTFRVFTHLLIMANWEDGAFMGTPVKRGQVITGFPSLASELGISVQSARTSINHLKSTGEITVKVTNKFSLITITNYNKFQNDNRHINRQPNSQSTVNQQSTNNIPEYKNIDKQTISSKEDKEKSYGDENINKTLSFLKQTIGIDDFVESGKWLRIYGKHMYDLANKLGKDEFLNRLTGTLEDKFHKKNCNKIRYLYEQIKAYVPKDNGIIRHPDGSFSF